MMLCVPLAPPCAPGSVPSARSTGEGWGGLVTHRLRPLQSWLPVQVMAPPRPAGPRRLPAAPPSFRTPGPHLCK